MPDPVLVKDLLRSSFRCIRDKTGGLRPGFSYSPSEETDALFILNAMLDSWATDELNAFCTLIQYFPLKSGKQQYTIGPGGDWAGTRPETLSKATLVILTNPVQPLRQDIAILDAYQWQSINLQLTPSTLVQKLFYNPTYKQTYLNTGQQGIVYVWPVPSENDAVELSSPQWLSAGFNSGANMFDAPPGYLDAVRYQLAIRLAMEWDQELKAGVVELASEALAKIQRRNAPTPQMDVDAGVLPIRTGRSGWSRLTGDMIGDS